MGPSPMLSPSKPARLPVLSFRRFCLLVNVSIAALLDLFLLFLIFWFRVRVSNTALLSHFWEILCLTSILTLTLTIFYPLS